MATWPTTTPVRAGGLVPSWLDCRGEAVSRVRSHISPGPYRSFRELSLAGSVDPVIWCPPTFVGNSGIERSNGHRGFALFLFGSMIVVMAGLVPAIHVFSMRAKERRGCPAAQTSLRSLRKADYYGRARRCSMSSLFNSNSANEKSTLRAAALAARDALSSEHRAAAAEAIALRGLPIEIMPGAVVAGYSPIRSEIDPAPLLRKLVAPGVQLALPAIMADDQPLKFRSWAFNDRLRRGRLGILAPAPDAAELLPDILLVPLARVDRLGPPISDGAWPF